MYEIIRKEANSVVNWRKCTVMNGPCLSCVVECFGLTDFSDLSDDLCGDRYSSYSS